MYGSEAARRTRHEKRGCGTNAFGDLSVTRNVESVDGHQRVFQLSTLRGPRLGAIPVHIDFAAPIQASVQ
jgi:hypothetical protein